MYFYITVLILFFSTATFAQDFNHSIQRDDNDLATYHDIQSNKVNNPQKVIDAFKSIVKSKSQESNELIFYSYRIVANEVLDIYTITINSNIDKKAFVFVFDKNRNRVSSSPIVIDLKSSFNTEAGYKFKLLDYPLINILQNHNELVICIRERVHNGNVYNAILNKHYILREDLLPKLQFCYEEKALLDDNTIIRRVLNNENVLEVLIERNSSSDYLGRITLDIGKGVIRDRYCKNEEYCEVLFTTSGLNEEELLRKGEVIQY